MSRYDDLLERLDDGGGAFYAQNETERLHRESAAAIRELLSLVGEMRDAMTPASMKGYSDEVLAGYEPHWGICSLQVGNVLEVRAVLSKAEGVLGGAKDA